MGTRFGPTIRILVLTLLITFLAVPGVAAAESRTGGAIVVEEGETIDDDLEAFGGTVVVRGTVTGDLDAFAGTVRIEGTVEGDVNAAAGDISIAPNGTVGGNLEAAAGNIRLAGTIDGDAQVAAEEITLARSASIGGNLEYGGNLNRADGATVGGTVTQSEGEVSPVGGFGPSVPGWTFDVYGYLVTLAMGAVLLGAFPMFSRSVTGSALEEPLRSGGLGLLALVGIPVLLVLFALTIIGIPLTILGAFLFALGAWLGTVYGRIAVGEWLTSVAGVENRWLTLLVGVTVIALLTRIPLVGGLVEFAVFLLGFGALVSNLTQGYRRRRQSGAGSAAESDAQTEPDGTPA